MKHYYRAVLAIFAALLLFVMTSSCTGIMLNQLLIDYDQGRSEIMDIYKDALPGSAGYEAYKEAKQNHQFLEELEENENFEGMIPSLFATQSILLQLAIVIISYALSAYLVAYSHGQWVVFVRIIKRGRVRRIRRA